MPSISFVIPVLNGEKTLENCIASVMKLHKRSDFEVIIVDNGSTDRSKKIAERLGVKLVTETRRGRSFARNKGWSIARHKWVAFIDCDVELDRDWLMNFEEHLEENFFDCFQGPIIPLLRKNTPFERFRLDLLSFQSGGSFCTLSRKNFVAPHLNTAACLVRRDLLVAIGGFDELLTTYEDVDLSWRLWRKGAKFLVENRSQAGVYWDRGGYLSYLKRAYAMGKGFGTFCKKWNADVLVVPDWHSFPYRTIQDRIAHFLNQLFFSIAFRLSQNHPQRETPLRKTKELVCCEVRDEKTVYELAPAIRLLKLPGEIILRNISTKGELVFVLTGPSTQKALAKVLMLNLNDLLRKRYLIHVHSMVQN